jgi:hypothetical protein
MDESRVDAIGDNGKFCSQRSSQCSSVEDDGGLRLDPPAACRASPESGDASESALLPLLEIEVNLVDKAAGFDGGLMNVPA